MKKTILITGSARRIGASIAKKFARYDYNIIIHYLSSKEAAEHLAKEIGNNSIAIRADLRKESDVEILFKTAIDVFGQVDILINNAAVFPPKHNIDELTLNDWNNTINANLTAQMLTAKQFAIQPITDGRIINFSSLGGIKTWDRRIDYNVSKVAVIQLSKSLARELAPHISVNCICPGIVKLDSDETLAIPAVRVPMQRYASVDDIFDAVYFFATASKYITGQTLLVDGGLSLC
ncbi:MAG: SDR family oxidoreductase [Ignavibacteria bacterium]|jgi:3-oxoacyl-[acyl-carrier protein] reductase/pteridine reductase|nr:SDR family oxidoreductase [Ignavibacteria bacterium]